MKHILFSMAIAIIALSTSCTKSSSYGGGGGGGTTSTVSSSTSTTTKTTSELLTAHSWVLSQTLYDGINTIEPCEEDNEFLFKTTGICSQNTHSLCVGEIADYSIKTWSYNAHTKKLHLEGTSQQYSQEYTLIKIDQSTLVLSPSTGIQFVYKVN